MNILCYDVGGTDIKYGLLNERADILEKGSIPACKDSLEAFLGQIKEIYDGYADKVEGVTMSMPGVIEPKTGYFHAGGAYNNIIHGINMKEQFAEFIDKPISIANDAKCAAQGELGYGSLKNYNDAIVVVLGTGVGGCLIRNKEIIYGDTLMAGEFSYILTNGRTLGSMIGHQCGIPGLIESVQKQLGTDEPLNGRIIFERANNGDEKVRQGIYEYCFDVATLINNLFVIFNPQVFAIGGGISAQPLLFEMIDKAFEDIAGIYGPYYFGKPEIIACQYRNDANLIGALHNYFVENGTN